MPQYAVRDMKDCCSDAIARTAEVAADPAVIIYVCNKKGGMVKDQWDCE